MSWKQNPNTAFLLTIGGITTLLLVVILIGLQAWFYDAQNREMQRKVIGQPHWALEDLRLKQLANLNVYEWVDADKQRARIPIDVAMQIVAREQAQQQRGDLP
jgi:hypothetical protein